MALAIFRSSPKADHDKIPRMGLQRTPVQKFGGLNTVDAPYDLPHGEASYLNNVRPVFIDDDESVEMRGGLNPIAGLGLGGYGGVAGTFTLASAIVHGIAMRDYSQVGSPMVIFWGKDNTGGTALFSFAGGTAINRLQASTVFVGDYASATASGGSGTYPERVYLIPYPAANPPVAKIVDNLVMSNLVGTNIPTTSTSLVYWRGRLIALRGEPGKGSRDADVARILYSNVGDPTNWGPPNFIDIFDQTGGDNCALLVHNNNLYLLKRDSLWLIYDPNTFANRLIATMGAGYNGDTRAICSCPYDRRIYWLQGSTGLIWSSNGETDLVCENRRAPLPVITAYTAGAITVLGSYRPRLIYDPVRKSILVTYPSNPGIAGENDQMDEIVLRGTPGSHPIFRHSIPTTAIMPTGTLIFCGSAQSQRIYDTFSDSQIGPMALTPSIGHDDGTSFNGQWVGGWMPLQSEELVERIRRVNAIYRGSPTIKIASAMDMATGVADFTMAPTPVWAGGGLGFTYGKSNTRRYVAMRGPNRKGRYHRVTVLGSGVVGQDFAVSAVELVFRGGKEKK